MSDEVFHPAVEDLPLSKVLAALADPARLAMVRTVAAADGLSCTVLGQEAGLELSKSTMSHHQRILRESGITLTRVQGSHRILRLRREELDGRFPGLLDAVLASPVEQLPVRAQTARAGRPAKSEPVEVH
ncbi:helix-turn-helix domain-containing protein [Streptomyces sp. W16]|uniref:ArsR/SmtB family transcription factor n=1 Tax=Streptomyces sp. W16 TaxID=3076631 RepID=UPI00295BC894|nr:helix-turn-helix domain-containing protein [Streptomyces sp. W16]MDV9178429.1 helix-turn-helix domain-containing protein [Streptomyces sp. W16]